MKGLSALIRIHNFELDQKRRALKEIEEHEAGIAAKISDLEAELLAEQEAARGSVEGGYSYGGYAQAAIARREALHEALAEAGRQVAVARDQVATAFEAVKKYEITKSNRDAEIQAEENRRETMELDELGLNTHTRGKGD